MFNLEIWQKALEQLSQAIYNHEQWHKDLTRTIICRLPHDQRDVAENAHQQCRFGQWYGSEAAQQLQAYESFSYMGIEHARMHQLAAAMLRSSADGVPVTQIDYDNFANSLERLRLQLYSLRREIEDTIYRSDPLTGAESRIDMLPRLREMLEMVKRRVQQSCIVLMDVDHFKMINDNYGHLIGDQVLKAAVQFLKENLRPYDKVFRYGGEEFLIAMPNSDLEACQAAAERLRIGLAATALVRDGLRPIFATASFGIAQLQPDVTLEDTIDRADKAMYNAKSDGRDRVCIWEPVMTRII